MSTGNHGEVSDEHYDDSAEGVDQINMLRTLKARAKGEFTNIQRGVLVDLMKGKLDEEAIENTLQDIRVVYERVSSIMSDLSGMYGARHDTKNTSSAPPKLALNFVHFALSDFRRYKWLILSSDISERASHV